jgi:hypothetical protein
LRFEDVDGLASTFSMRVIDSRDVAPDLFGRGTLLATPTLAADQVTFPRMLIYQPSPAEDVVCQHVIPLYFADTTVTAAFEPANAPQWVKDGSKQTMADMSRCCFNTDR